MGGGEVEEDLSKPGWRMRVDDGDMRSLGLEENLALNKEEWRTRILHMTFVIPLIDSCLADPKLLWDKDFVVVQHCLLLC